MTRDARDNSLFVSSLLLLAVASGIALLNPLALIFRLVSRSYNEGWNAFWTQAVSHSGQLYTSVDSYIANNYPPVSFYLVAFVGRMTGDHVIAGRLVSLASFVVLVLASYLFLRATGAKRLT